MPTTHEWQNIAVRRIVSVLRRRKICSVSQLESKIAEAGPPNIRAQPLSIRDGLAHLLDQGSIQVVIAKGSAPNIDRDFYALNEFSLDRYTDRGQYDLLLQHWPRYIAAARDTALCGDVLESIVDQSVSDIHGYIRLGKPGEAYDGWHVDGQVFNNAPPLDHVIWAKELGARLGVEDKNIRNWMYPNDLAIRTLLRKCVDNDYHPIIVTRKLPYLTRLLFGRLGILGFETHSQYFHPSTEADLALVRHKDGVGLADMRFTNEPSANITHFFQNTVPAHLEESSQRFKRHAELISEFAHEEIGYHEFVDRLEVFHELGDASPWGDMTDYYEDH